LSADEIAAQNKEEINANPPEALHFKGQDETEQSGVVDDDKQNGESAQQVEPRAPMRAATRIEVSGTDLGRGNR
jgi:hypothetical protein